MIPHTLARDYTIKGFKSLLAREPSLPEWLLPCGVALLETQYSAGWSTPEWRATNNCGAITAGRGWDGETFEHRDSRPLPDGTNEWYVTKFRVYPDLAAGMKDVVAFCYTRNTTWGRCSELVLPKATAGDLEGFSTGLYVTHYYRGFGKTDEQRIAGHVIKLTHAVAEIARACGTTMPDGSALPAPPPPTVRLGSTGDAVVTVQVIVGATPDGIAGKKTAAKIAAWQRARHLKADSIFGPVCWAEAKKEGLVHA